MDAAVRGELDLTPEQWLDTVLLATANEDLAQQYFNAAVRRDWARKAGAGYDNGS